VRNSESRNWITKLRLNIRKFDALYLNSFLKKKKHPKRLKLYGIGTPKSGTHSIREIFRNHFRTLHEPGREELLKSLMGFQKGNISRRELKKFVELQETKYWVEVNSSCYNYFILDELLDINPGAKYILTIRNPYAWMNSWYNHQLYGFPKEVMPFFNQVFKADQYEYSAEEEPLKKRNLPPISNLLIYWKSHNNGVIEKVPKKNLLIIKTRQISERFYDIIRFSGFDPTEITPRTTHSFILPKKINPLKKVDKHFIKLRVDQYCGDLIQTYFPEIEKPEDGLPLLRYGNNV